MGIAWKVMLPWGMVNLLMVALWIEFGVRWLGASGFTGGLWMFLAGWATLAVTWLLTAWTDPNRTDNRPIVELPEVAKR